MLLLFWCPKIGGVCGSDCVNTDVDVCVAMGSVECVTGVNCGVGMLLCWCW